MLIIYFIFNVCLLAFAGGEIDEDVLAELEKTCGNESSGESCIMLAGETLCGRGYNEETATLLKKGCAIHQKKCSAGSQSDCREYAICLTGCSKIDDPFYENMSNGLVSEECHVSGLNKSGPELNTEIFQMFEGLCSQKDPRSCYLASMMLRLQPQTEKDIEAQEKSLALLKKACLLGESEACPQESEGSENTDEKSE
jgi:hypothetical protein